MGGKVRFQSGVTLILWSVLAGLFLYAQSPTQSAPSLDLAGGASVIDGDTLEIRGRRVRLHGIDAPESDQLCSLDGGRYRCGQKAAFALTGLIGRRTVSCARRDTDRYGRAVAVCSAGGQDLGGWMVRHGHALAYRRYSRDYVDAEEAAAAEKLGIWAGAFEAPWDWRRR
jgi:endonuclease YncB( thermonuclease family)